jgi:multidrug efflux pump subunit AcrA (membrane-fusion protein)
MSQTRTTTPTRNWARRRLDESRAKEKGRLEAVHAERDQKRAQAQLRRTEKKLAFHKRLRWTGNIRVGEVTQEMKPIEDANESSLRDLQNEVRNYQQFVGQGLSDEDLARRDLDIAIFQAKQEAKSNVADADKVREASERLQQLARNYETLTNPEPPSGSWVTSKYKIIEESKAAHENDTVRMKAATRALIEKREALVSQAYDDVWMGSLSPDASISDHQLAQIQEFRNRWNITEFNEPLGAGEITDPEVMIEYAELHRITNPAIGRAVGTEQVR